MKSLGHKGGSTFKMTAARKAAAQGDDNLREAARAVLSKALAGEEVDREQLSAARSLYSFQAARPPASDDDGVPLSDLEVPALAWLRRLDALSEARLQETLSSDAENLINSVSRRTRSVQEAVEMFERAVAAQSRRENGLEVLS